MTEAFSEAFFVFAGCGLLGIVVVGAIVGYMRFRADLDAEDREIEYRRTHR